MFKLVNIVLVFNFVSCDSIAVTLFSLPILIPSRFKPEKVLRHEDLQGAPLLILANKQVSKDC